MKILVPAFAFGLSVSCASLPASAGAFEDCASTTATTAIAGCTQVLKTAKIKKSEQSLVYAMRGLSYLNAGEPQLAIKDLEKSVALNAKNFQAFQALGLALQSTGLYAESIAAFDNAVALKPSDATTISYRGYSHMLSKNFKASLADFDAAVKLQPKNPSLHTARGDVLKKIGGLPVALAAYSKAIALDPNYASAYEGRGLVHLVLANADAALADFDKAIARNAKSSLSYAARAKAHYLRNEIDQGLADAAKATELAPNDAYMQAALGTGYLSQGDYAKAAEIFQAAIVAESNSAPALRGAALAALAMDDADTTIALTDTALLQKPEDLQPYATRGHAVLRKGRVEEAISNFEKALSGDNLDGEAYWGLGLAYAQKGETEKAKTNLAESVKPHRLLPYQKLMAEQALQKLVAGDLQKTLIRASALPWSLATAPISTPIPSPTPRAMPLRFPPHSSNLALRCLQATI
jgi:tetratricopeptide (TPR) repeat protein